MISHLIPDFAHDILGFSVQRQTWWDEKRVEHMQLHVLDVKEKLCVVHPQKGKPSFTPLTWRTAPLCVFTSLCVNTAASEPG